MAQRTETPPMTIPLAKPWITQEDIDAVLGVLQTPTLSMGPQVRLFETP